MCFECLSGAAPSRPHAITHSSLSSIRPSPNYCHSNINLPLLLCSSLILVPSNPRLPSLSASFQLYFLLVSFFILPSGYVSPALLSSILLSLYVAFSTLPFLSSSPCSSSSLFSFHSLLPPPSPTPHTHHPRPVSHSSPPFVSHPLSPHCPQRHTHQGPLPPSPAPLPVRPSPHLPGE